MEKGECARNVTAPSRNATGNPAAAAPADSHQLIVEKPKVLVEVMSAYHKADNVEGQAGSRIMARPTATVGWPASISRPPWNYGLQSVPLHLE